MELSENIPEVDLRIKVAAIIGLTLLTGFVFISLGPGLNSVGSSVQPQSLEAGSDLAADRAGSESGSESRIVTTVRTTIKVNSVDQVMDSISVRAQELGGFIESSSIDRDQENRGSMTVKVPDENLSDFENSIDANWKIKSRNVNQEDVTDSYNELEVEIESLRTEYNRLQELINQTDNVETLIKLQERMSTVRSQLNYNQQRFDNLQEDVQYSEVHITLEGPQSFQSRFNLQETLSDAYRAVFDSINLLIVGAAYLVPFALVYGVYRFVTRIK